jgi:N-acetyl sugar amidotransferase
MKGKEMVEELEAYYGLPEEVKFCKKCVVSNQRPRGAREFAINSKNERKETMHFDEDGVCDACLYAEMKKDDIDWDERERMLSRLCDKYRSKDGSYDVIVPGSGGKDSGIQAHTLKYKYGMNPLTVTWSPQMYTEIGWRNFKNWITVGGFDNYLFNPNGSMYRLFTREAFYNLYNPLQPFIYGHKYIGPRMALMQNVKLVMYGENIAEYGNKKSDNDVPYKQPKLYSVERLDLDKLFLSGLPVKELMKKHNLSMRDVKPFLPIERNELVKRGVEFHCLGYYLKWTPQESYYYAIENTGFEPNPKRLQGSYTKYKSIDAKMDWIHFYTYWFKFGIGKATVDASQEIRNGHITREEGVALVHRYDGEFPSDYFQDFLDYIGITDDQFWERADKARSPHLWKKENGKWDLRHRVTNL